MKLHMWQTSTLIVAFILVQTTLGYDYFVAEFTGPVFGTIEFHPQLDGGIQIETNLRADLISRDHMYHIHEAVVMPGVDCAAAGDHVDSWSVNDPGYDICDPNAPQFCHVGDLSGKHDTLDFGVDFEYGEYMDYNLYVSNLTNRSIVIHGTNLDSTTRFACANVVGKIYPQFISVNFTDVYWGAMVFRTRSDGTLGIVHKLRTHIGDSIDHQYHVHEDPVVDGDSTCLSSGRHYDPTEKEIGIEYYNQNLCTPADISKCFYGDLEGKYGKLQLTRPSSQEDAVSEKSVADTQLLLPKIWKRSVVIHQAGGGSEIILCDTLELQDFTEAVAVFDGDVEGEIYFRMHHDGTMRISYDLANSNHASSNNHKVHVHNDNVLDDDNSCASAGGHYDPRGVEVDGYSCDPDNVETCYHGDLSGKFAQINLPHMSSWRDQQMTVNDIIGRSIVIHVSDGSARLACATIMPTAKLPEMAAAEIDDGDEGLEGYVVFRTQSNDQTAMLANVENTSGQSRKYIVTEDETMNKDCDTSGDLFNPTNVHASSAYGALTNRYHLNVGDYDFQTTYDIRVPDVVHRSLAVTDSVNNKLACAPITEFPDVIYAEASFSQGNIWGSVEFRRMEGETMISFNLMHASGSSASDLRWYINEDPAIDCHLSRFQNVWDPFMLGNSEMCNQNNFATCKVGDFSSKHGDLSFPAWGVKMDRSFTVADVIGRSIVIANNQGSVQVCATIMPKKYVTELAVVELLRGLILFRQAGDTTSIVYSLIGTSASSNVFISETCDDLPAQPIANVMRPSMLVGTIETKVDDLVGQFLTIDGECVEIVEYIGGVSDMLDVDAVAPFDGPITGSMEFARVNRTGLPMGFELKLDIANADGTLSQGHWWHGHNFPIVKDEGCASAGGHYDPLVVEVPGYSCDAEDPMATCYHGDFSGRYEIKLPIPIEASLFDADVPLVGLIGRSVVIHEANSRSGRAARYDCATIFPIPKTLTPPPTPEPTREQTAAPTETPTPSPTRRQPTASTTPFPTRDPTTSRPTFSPTEGDDAGAVNAAANEGGSGGSSTGLILGILLPLLFCCICIPIAYYAYIYYEERDTPDALKSKKPWEDVDFECPAFCPSFCKGSDSSKSAFRLGRYNNPTSSFNVDKSGFPDPMSVTDVHKCPHGLKTFTVDEENWFCSTCQKRMLIGETMHGCRICDVDQCNRCNELAILPKAGSLMAPPSLPSVPNQLAPHRSSRLSMKPPSRDNSREPSPARDPSQPMPSIPSMIPRTVSKNSTHSSVSSPFSQEGKITLPQYVKNHADRGSLKEQSTQSNISSTSSIAPPESIPSNSTLPPTLPPTLPTGGIQALRGSAGPPALPKAPGLPPARNGLPPGLPPARKGLPPGLPPARKGLPPSNPGKRAPAPPMLPKAPKFKPSLTQVGNDTSDYTIPNAPEETPPNSPLRSRDVSRL